MASENWAHEWAFEPCRVSQESLKTLLNEADRLLADAKVTAISVASRHALAHGAVVLLAKMALAAAGYRTVESHHYWSLVSLKHTIGLSDDDVDVLQQHRGRRHDALYGSARPVSETQLRDLLDRAVVLRKRVLSWLLSEHADLWESDTA